MSIQDVVNEIKEKYCDKTTSASESIYKMTGMPIIELEPVQTDEQALAALAS